jgi:hypothetical protein
MSDEWLQPSRDRSAYRYPMSNPSPHTIRRVEQIVPTGTVASRIVYIQNLANTANSTNAPVAAKPLKIFHARPDSPTPSRRENSRMGYGRRASARFAQPALKTSNPHERLQVDDSHSFLGLNTPYTNLLDPHAKADPSMKWGRSPSMQAGFKAAKDGGRGQYEVTNPWIDLPNINPGRPMTAYCSQTDSGSAKVSKYKTRPNDPLQPKLFPTVLSYLDEGPHAKHPMEAAIAMETWSPGHQKRPELLGECAFSTETTSTMRRQSVRDIYNYYGIERPSGLVSSDYLQDDFDTLQLPANTRRYCHLCHWVNGEVDKCWGCGHRLCQQCDELSVCPKETDREFIDCNKRLSQHVVKLQPESPLITRYSAPGVEKQNLAPEAPPRRSSKQSASKYSRQKPTAKVEPFPSLQVEVPTPRRGSRNTTAGHIKTPHHIKMLLEPQVASKLSTIPQESLFIAAEMPPSSGSLRLLPVAMRITHTTHSHRHRSRGSHRSHGSHESHSSYGKPQLHRSRVPYQESPQPKVLPNNILDDIRDCGSPGCSATHAGHQPYRHSISCSRCKHHQLTPKEADSDYAAGTSFIGEEVKNGHSRNEHVRHTRIYAVEGSQPVPHEHIHNKSHAETSEIKIIAQHQALRKTSLVNVESQKSEYVECHGYPRTGHARHSSPISSGVVGKCQHCLNDCQCEACQNTHHSVRCCVHEEHHPFAHLHHTLKKETVGLVEKLTSNLSPPRLVEQSLVNYRSSQAPKKSPSIVIAPTPKRKLSSPPWMVNDIAIDPVVRRQNEPFVQSEQKPRAAAKTKATIPKKLIKRSAKSSSRDIKEVMTVSSPKSFNQQLPNYGDCSDSTPEPESENTQNSSSHAEFDNCIERWQERTKPAVANIMKSPRKSPIQLSVETSARRLSAYYEAIDRRNIGSADAFKSTLPSLDQMLLARRDELARLKNEEKCKEDDARQEAKKVGSEEDSRRKSRDKRVLRRWFNRSDPKPKNGSEKNKSRVVESGPQHDLGDCAIPGEDNSVTSKQRLGKKKIKIAGRVREGLSLLPVLAVSVQ